MKILNIEKLVMAAKQLELENICEDQMELLYDFLGDDYTTLPNGKLKRVNKNTESVSNLYMEYGDSLKESTNLTPTGILDKILINKRILPEEYRENLPVYDATDDRYYRLRYIYKTDSYEWCDDWGNIINGHELWRHNF